MYVVEMSEVELACRLIEAVASTTRPEGYTAERALLVMPPCERDKWLAAARTAIEYLQECMAARQVIQ